MFNEIQNGVETNVQVLRSSPLVQIGVFQRRNFTANGGLERFFESSEVNELGNLHLLSETVTEILAKVGSISVEGKGIWTQDFNFKGLTVDFSHTFNFLELDVVTIDETVSLFFVGGDLTGIVISNGGDNGLLGFFTSSVENRELLAKVDESEAVKTEDTRVDETDGLVAISADLVEFNQLLSIIKVGEDDNIEIGKEISGNFTVVNFNSDIRVQ